MNLNRGALRLLAGDDDGNHRFRQDTLYVFLMLTTDFRIEFNELSA